MTVVQPELSLVLDEDAETRVAIVDDLGDTMFIEAGAGSGKTKSLVDRVVVAYHVVRQVPMREIAAVTFTEKAAAELRDRIRRELEQVASGSPFGHGAGHDRARAALDELDAAAVSTLHAFAQRILGENPIEAGLPPRIEVLDDIGSQVAFEDRWTRFVDLLLDDPALERTLLLALNADTGLVTLRTLALACNANWDLVAERMRPRARPSTARARPAPGRARRPVARSAAALHSTPDDKLADGLVAIGRLARAARAQHPTSTSSSGCSPRARRSSAPGPGGRPTGRRRATSTTCAPRSRALREHAAAITQTITEATVRRLAWEIAQFTLREADERRRPAASSSSTTCSCCRRAMLRDPSHGWDVRRRLRARYTHLLLDEFQDTDPIQCDLAALLASGDPDARDHLWNEIAVDPGRLFVVGDPKQSIYRFRRADIAAFLRARSAFGAAPRHLTRNFRTTRRMIEFVNAVFRDLIAAEPESQPEYVALVPDRGDAPVRPGPVLLGVAPHGDRIKADGLREREAADVAAAITTALTDQWPRVEARARRAPSRGSRVVWATSRSCCRRAPRSVSSKTRSTLPASRIAPRRRRSSTARVRSATCCMVLQAVDDPTDELSLVERAALAAARLRRRRPLHVPRRPRRALEPPGAAARDVAVRPCRRRCDARARRVARRAVVARSRASCSTASSASVVCSSSAFAHGRPRDLWRRVRFVIDQARAFSEVTGSTPGRRAGGGLRDFLRLGRPPEQRGRARGRDRAARDRRRRGAHPHHPRRQGTRVPDHDRVGHDHRRTPASHRRAAAVPPRLHDLRAARVEAGHHRGIRAVRADRRADGLPREAPPPLCRTHPRARPPRGVGAPPGEVPDPTDQTKWTHAELLWEAAADAPHWTELEPVVSGLPAGRGVADGTGPVPRVGRVDRRSATSRSRWESAPRVWSATAVATAAAERAVRADPGLAKDARDLELPPWNKGRYGTAVGSAVHAVLQTVDLVDGRDIDETAAAQAAAEGVIGREDDIAALARSALASRTVREAVATSDYRREMYVATQVEGHTLEGYVDLVYRTAEGLVVVDYKTDAWRDESDLDAKVERYRLQGASYAARAGGSHG